MAQIGNVILCAAAMIILWSLIGLPIAVRVATGNLSWFIAPALGWSVFSVVTLPLFSFVGISRPYVIGVTVAFVGGAIASLWNRRYCFETSLTAGIVIVAAGAAAVLALVPLASVLPKETIDGVRLAIPIFDHSKIAMIDEIIRIGVPPVNPFFNEAGAPQRLSYYYLWHYSAAVIAILTGGTGWEGDAALTWFTGFSSLLVVMGFSTWLSGRNEAALFVIAMATTASLRTIVEWLFGEGPTHSLIRGATGLGGWLFQISWAPQHVASAMLVILACYLIAQLRERRDPSLVVTLALVVAAGFQSSVWAGGFALAISATAIGLRILWELPSQSRGPFLARAAVAVVLATALLVPFLYDQVTITAMRDSGWPIRMAPLPVVGEIFPDSIRRLIDIPAYWVIYLPVEFPAFYPAGAVALLLLLRDRSMSDERSQVVRAFGFLLVGSLLCSWLLIGDLGGNNDLAWRAILPAVLLLICFAATGLTQWIVAGNRALAGLALMGILVGLPEAVSFAMNNIVGKPTAFEQSFAKSPAMWEAIRRHSSATERIANNPDFLGDITPWPVNMSWALLSDRRSCYAGYNLGIPFAPVSAARRTEVDEQFLRVFNGKPAADDVRQLADRYGCDLAVVTPSDGAWGNDPFASSDSYRLVEDQPGEWRIYRKSGQ